jgi:hypothetical protein
LPPRSRRRRAQERSVDLEAQTITTPEGRTLRFEIDRAGAKACCRVDEVMLTLQRDHEIRSFQEAAIAPRGPGSILQGSRHEQSPNMVKTQSSAAKVSAPR